MDIKLLVGKRVRELRNSIGISQEELADLAGLDRTYITSVECGKRNISIVNIEKLAKQGENTVKLPKMLKNYDGGEFDFSYSGLKTAVINYVHNAESRNEEINRANVAKSFEVSAISVLVEKALLAVKKTGVKTIAVSGGVGANAYLRESLTKMAKENGLKLVLPEKRYCTDNGAMIGAEGYLQYLKGNFADLTLNASAVVPFK